MTLLNAQLLFVSFLALILYVAIGVVYRLYFSPIAHFPGSPLAKVSFWYEFYWDVIKRGKYTFEIEKMHAVYGPIIRINPYELHIKDSEFYDKVNPYAAAGKRVERWSWQAMIFGNPLSVFATVPHELHRMRRNALSPFFSKRAVNDLTPVIRYHVSKAVSRLRKLRHTNTPINLIDMFACLTSDVISDYAYGKPYGFLDTEDFHPECHRSWKRLTELGATFKQFPLIYTLMQSFPDWLVLKTQPHMLPLIQSSRDTRRRISSLKDGRRDQEKTSQHRTILEELVESEHIPEAEKTVDRLVDESMIIIGAGTISTADVLAGELQPVIDAKGPAPEWQELERLPYLAAIVKEGLRVAYGAVGRLSRVFPDESLQYKDFVIPAKTVVSMSTYFMHNDPTIFPEPRSFKPERWLANEKVHLTNYLTSFGKGTRQCVGMQLAYAEIYLTLAAIFAPGQFDLELFETDITDVEMRHDFMVPSARLDSKGIRIVVK